jgi:hypothetical protein
VWDTYRSELRAYNARLLELDPAAAPVPEAEQAAMVGASVDAFEALERQLAAQQRAAQQQKQAGGAG